MDAPAAVTQSRTPNTMHASVAADSAKYLRSSPGTFRLLHHLPQVPHACQQLCGLTLHHPASMPVAVYSE